MIDLHNHLLPGIDDGAKELQETLEFLRIGARDGVRTVIATPHMKPGVYDNSRQVILELVAKQIGAGTDPARSRSLPSAQAGKNGSMVLSGSFQEVPFAVLRI